MPKPRKPSRLLAAGVFVWLAGAAPARPSEMTADLTRVMDWLSQEMAHGLAFNAGSAFDPPAEIKGLALAPDLSIGAGVMPLDKNKFPTMRSSELSGLGMAEIFPSKAMFPNMTAHFRAGLPWRGDFSFRFTDMTTPPGYKISATATGKGQSNSIGFGLRQHFFGGDRPKLAIGANYNHVFGRFQYFTVFNIDRFSVRTDHDVTGTIQWNVNSFGVNAVVSQDFGGWIPFVGAGYNYATGSVRSRLEVVARTPFIPALRGEASNHPEPSQARLILGAQVDYSWMHFFVNGEIKAVGVTSGRSWIAQGGFMLPFRIGSTANTRAAQARQAARSSALRAEPEDSVPDMIFIQ